MIQLVEFVFRQNNFQDSFNEDRRYVPYGTATVEVKNYNHRYKNSPHIHFFKKKRVR